MADSDTKQKNHRQAIHQRFLFERDIKGRQFSCKSCGKLEFGRLPKTRLCKSCLAKKKGLSDCLCATCGKELSRDRIAGLTTDRNPVLYCSRACLGKGKRGANHHAWKGGKYIDVGGYVKIRVDGEYTQEHRHVMEQALGRKLHQWETVHHKDGNRQNNHISNLELWGSRHPRGQFFKDWVDKLMSGIVDKNPRCFVAANFSGESESCRQVYVTNADSGDSFVIPLV